MAVRGEGFVETIVETHDGRAYYVNPKGQIADLPKSGTPPVPPIITGLATDGQRLLVDRDGSGTLDLFPDVVGLTAQSIAALKKYVFTNKVAKKA